MTLMQRRRAMMAGSGGDSSYPITNLTAGTEVKISENGTLNPYIYLGTNTQGNAIVLRKLAMSTQKAYATAANKPEYANSQLDTWLINTITEKYTQKLKDNLVNSDITYATYDDSYAETINTISRKIFIPSKYELGGGGNEGGTNFLSALKAYKNTTSANTARATEQDGGATFSYLWTRTELSNSSAQNKVQCYQRNGILGTNDYQASNGVNAKTRQMLSLKSTTPITDTDDGKVVCL